MTLVSLKLLKNYVLKESDQNLDFDRIFRVLINKDEPCNICFFFEKAIKNL